MDSPCFFSLDHKYFTLYVPDPYIRNNGPDLYNSLLCNTYSAYEVDIQNQEISDIIFNYKYAYSPLCLLTYKFKDNGYVKYSITVKDSEILKPRDIRYNPKNESLLKNITFVSQKELQRSEVSHLKPNNIKFLSKYFEYVSQK